MGRKAAGLFVKGPEGPFERKEFERRAVSAKDVDIDIKYAGICASDMHTATNDWRGSDYSELGICPGHEIAGVVRAVGSEVTKFKVGDRVGVGCMVDSCRTCEDCQEGNEQLCGKGNVPTYNGRYKFDHHPDKGAKTYGGYSTNIVVDEAFVLRIPDNLTLDKAAPLLCCGITTFSPLYHYGLKKGQHFAVAGLGGLGHMAVKFALAIGAKVTVLSRGTAKREDARKLGAHDYVDVTNKKEMRRARRSIHFILDTISAKHDLNAYLRLLKNDGKLIIVGGAPDPLPLQAFSLIGGRKIVGGSPIGGIAETQTMLDFCGEHNVYPDIELISADYVHEAYKRLESADVRYRFVIDASSLEREIVFPAVKL
ncbi:Cinnamyl alcohol dehydrogenase 8 [Hondaea fermentalgiana]|uniref:Cinnamyl alcohol dehydrogenase 8 n=1 Tax=Hondaea fermentalgiana TaxID=2315210 RepID=A0A2R5GJV7_9STRA|nr:Cinnamyl alcohol dehydrogenase 8 [Hondaea fermentalgiana]|eukprot:GBG30018.1 Cinnamyl alcohol dehydrogenase 8 [Hondaea fermentalgiana]